MNVGKPTNKYWRKHYTKNRFIWQHLTFIRVDKVNKDIFDGYCFSGKEMIVSNIILLKPKEGRRNDHYNM